ncbi:hypothetical protein ABZ790_31570 [Saccharopolyspora shandongensis]
MNASIDATSARTGAGRLVIVLGGLSAVSPFATDMYAPGFPQIVTSFATSGTAVQLSLTACLVGLVIGRAVISDRFTGPSAARKLSTLSTIAMTAPVLAPVAGGLVLGVGSWRLVFGQIRQQAQYQRCCAAPRFDPREPAGDAVHQTLEHRPPPGRHYAVTCGHRLIFVCPHKLTMINGDRSRLQNRSHPWAD